MLQSQMLRMQLTPYLRFTQFSRQFSTNILRQRNSSTKGDKTSESRTDNFHPGDGGYIPTNIDKIILVWTKKYTNRDDIPKTISSGTITDARSKARIKICNYMMLITFFACLYNIYIGRIEDFALEDATDGIDMHKQIREDYIRAEREQRNE